MLIFGSIYSAMLGWLMGFLSVFLILLILIQRGKGGGLTGALGGPGGQSAFGSKAGDTFTLITIVVASIWGFTCAFTMWLLGTHAPTVTLTDEITAGPVDDRDVENEFLITPPDLTGGSGADSIGGTGEDTPSMELTPADSSATDDAAPADDASPADDAPDSSTDAPEETSADEASESSDGDEPDE